MMGFVKRDVRRSDNGDEDRYKQRRLIDNSTLIKVLIALMLGGGATGTITFLSSADKNTIQINKQEVLRLQDQLKAHYESEKSQEKLFDSKLKTLETKIDGINDKIDLLIKEIK